MKIVAFGFRRGTGKDTLCKMVHRELRLANSQLQVKVAGFADLMKLHCYHLYGWLGVRDSQYYEEHPSEKEVPLLGLPNGYKSVRDLWIGYCNEIKVLLNDPLIWINSLLKTQSCNILLIKDLRFEYELEAVHDCGGVVNRLDRPGTEGADGQPDTVLMNETRWDNVYENTGDLNDLHRIAMKVAKELYH